MDDRQRGVTTKQMEMAPKDSFYIWHGDLMYARDLAKHIGRDDLKIVSPSWLTAQRWRGQTCEIIVDHYAVFKMSGEEHSNLVRSFFSKKVDPKH